MGDTSMPTSPDTKESVFTRGENALSEREAKSLFREINQTHLPYFMNVDRQAISLFLPHCLKSRHCPASSDDEGVHCEKCGQCVMAHLVAAAEEAGIRVFCAPGGTLIKALIKKYRPRAVIGVACWKEILLAFELLWDSGIFLQVFPLERDGCFETSVNPEQLVSFLSELASQRDAGQDEWAASGSAEKLLIDGLAAACLPQTYDVHILSRLCGGPAQAYDAVGPTKAIAEPLRDILSRNGKGMRTRLFSLILRAFGKEEAEYRDFMFIPELSHNGTLIIDDIEDDSSLRRGKPCIHHLYGTDVAMNAGNALYFLSLLPLLSSDTTLPDSIRSKIFEIYVQSMINLHFGQSMDIAWHRGFLDVEKISEENYLQMSSLKTGALFRMSAQIAGALARVDDTILEELGQFACSIGVAYQIKDDVLDIEGDKFAEGKGGQGKDITEGKVTLMVIHALRNAGPAGRTRLKEILSMHTSEPALVMEAVEIIRHCGSPEYALQKAEQIVQEAFRRVDPVLPSGILESGIEEFTTSLLRREL
jgi:geranylgeranyl pyrophosphate synthase